MPLLPADNPEEEQVQLRVMDEQVTLTHFKSYEFASDFLTPSDGWSFTVGDEDLPEREANALLCRARIRLYVNNLPVADGHIDDVEETASKGSGKEWSISGRDRLALAVDSGALPNLEFPAGTTLDTFLRTIFAPYGWGGEDHFVIDNIANRNARTGALRGAPTSRGRRAGRPLKSFKLHQLKPYNNEGVYTFAARVAQRFGLWIWPTADGEQLVVSTPDFAQEPTFTLARLKDGSGNIISGGVKRSSQDQPSVIFADSFSGGSEYGKGRVKVFCVNPYFGIDQDGQILKDVSKLILQVPDANQVTMVTQPFERRVATTIARPLYIHDEESKTLEQLEYFVRREMSLLMRKAFQYSVVVEGHGQMVNGNFVPWTPDTTVRVYDEVSNVNEILWVLGVRFHKAKQGGTTTRLTLLRLNSVQFGVADQATGPKPASITSLDPGATE
jgi:prophage tail gpP-like protein